MTGKDILTQRSNPLREKVIIHSPRIGRDDYPLGYRNSILNKPILKLCAEGNTTEDILNV